MPGIGGAQSSSLSAKGHPKREIKIQKTPKYGAEHREGEVDAHMTVVYKNTTPTDWDPQVTGPLVKANRGGAGVRMMEADRVRKGPSDRRNPGAVRDLGAC